MDRDVPPWMIASLQQARSSAMSPLLVRAMLVAYLTARRAGPTPIDAFLALFPDTGISEREMLVTLNGQLLEAEMAGLDMDNVFDEIEVRVGADLMREIQRCITDLGPH